MITIWKYPLSGMIPGITKSFDIPVTAKVLCVKLQHNIPTIWMLVDTESANQKRTFVIFPTGGYMLDFQIPYLDTVQDNNGLVWHVFEVTEVGQ